MDMKKEVQHEKLAEELRKQKVTEEKRKLILKEVKDKIKKENTMSLSIKEGAFNSVKTGLVDSYIIPFALALNANNLQVGLLISFSSLLPPISQLYGSKLMERYSRRRIIVTYVSLHALMLLPIIVLSLLFWRSILLPYLPFLLILFYTLYAIFASISLPAWFSLMGDIVPENIRGRYFGKRNRIVGIVALIIAILAAFFLDFFKTKGLLLIGFSVFFLIAMIARLVSASMLEKHYNPRFRQQKKAFFSFYNFISNIHKYNFSKFSLFVAVMHFSVAIAGPFFAVFMLKELGFSYAIFMMISSSPRE